VFAVHCIDSNVRVDTYLPEFREYRFPNQSKQERKILTSLFNRFRQHKFMAIIFSSIWFINKLRTSLLHRFESVVYQADPLVTPLEYHEYTGVITLHTVSIANRWSPFML
jgi:hypothetical protein